MKLAALAIATTLGLAGLAHADPSQQLGNVGDPARPRGQFRQLLLERFDRNHDGRLEPEERRKAIRTLRRIARNMAMQERRAEGREARQGGRQRGERGQRDDARRERLLRRFDTNHDGVVGPDEMPPGMARRLRPLDRNRDGWLDDRDRP
jgi:Ca2+-binding EF-hand superfamily protein